MRFEATVVRAPPSSQVVPAVRHRNPVPTLPVSPRLAVDHDPIVILGVRLQAVEPYPRVLRGPRLGNHPTIAGADLDMSVPERFGAGADTGMATRELLELFVVYDVPTRRRIESTEPEGAPRHEYAVM
jgi:hypothetical protein